MTRLCLLYGALRSGTTMLRLMLDGHPRLTCPGETDFLTDHLRPAPGTPTGWRYDLEALAADRIFRASPANLPETDEAEAAFAAMIADLGEGAGEDGTLVLVAHRGLDRLLDLRPRMPVLHLLRDPRDVARSAVGMGWAGNSYYGAETWLKTEAAWEASRQRLPLDQVHTLRYESLVRQPEAELDRVMDFLGLAYDPGLLTYAEHSTYAPPAPDLAEQWRQQQDQRELGLLEPRLGRLMEARGYAASGAPAITPGPGRRLGLWLQNKRGVWGHRIGRYGVIDPLLLAAGTRLHLAPLARGAQARIDRKKIARLK